MNHTYRLIFSTVLNTWVAVAECARGRGKTKRSAKRSAKRSTKRRAVVLAALCLVPPAFAAPQGGQVTSGAGQISQQGTTTTINQSSQNLSLSWKSFNTNANETVNFVQPSASAIAVNRILDTNGTQFLGHLNANGQVWLINPNGILFGQSAQVNVGGLVASTLDVNDNQLSSSTRSFGGTSQASVVNQGRINGRYVALLGHTVQNTGTLTADAGSNGGGTAALGAGSQVTLTFADNQLLSLKVDQSALNALADNGGLIRADGGTVLLSAGAKEALLASVVNNSGVIQAQTVGEHNGTIVLMGGMAAGTTQVAGTLDASAPNGGNGGFVETSAHTVRVADGTRITTQAKSGQTGTWLIDPTDFTISAGSAPQSTSGIGANTLQTNLVTNNVTLQTDGSGSGSGDIHVNADVSWDNTTLTLSAHRNININANLNGGIAGMLALRYGQGAVALGNTAMYKLNGGAIYLGEGNNFRTQLGIDGPVVNYKVITRLGAAGSTTGTDLQGISGNLRGNYVLGADIDAGLTSSWNNNGGPAYEGFEPLGYSIGNRFSGVFDGLGHTIKNLTINRADEVGLFGATSSQAIVRNVGLSNAQITGLNFVGGLVGTNQGTITNVYVQGNVTGDGMNSYHIGGLVGHNDGGTISNAYTLANVQGYGYVGGLAGTNTGTITNAYTTWNTWGNSTGSHDIGGLVGNNSGTITNTYAMGRLYGDSNVGVLIGSNSGTVSNSYWNSTTSNKTTSAGGTGLSTAELAAALPTGFDPTVWDNAGNKTTPYLKNFGWAPTSGSVILGSDTSSSPTYYSVLTNVNQLQQVGSNLFGSYVLGNHIDASATSGWNLSAGTYAGFNPIGDSTNNFAGTFDGLGHTISGLTINRSSQSNVGLFGYTHTLATIRNVGLVGGSIQGYSDVGSLVGRNLGRISTSFATSSVLGNASYGSGVGGLVGNNYGVISDSYATGAVSGASRVGGLVGSANYKNASTAIRNSYSTGSLVGYQDPMFPTDSNSYGNVTTANTASSFSGWSIDTTGGDASKTWRLYEGSTTPLLKAFMTTATVTPAYKITTYNGSTQSTTSDITLADGSTADSSKVLGTASLAYTQNGNTATPKNAGTYSVRYNGGLYSDQQGYDLVASSTAGTLRIDKATATLGTASKTYDGGTAQGNTTLSITGVGSETLSFSGAAYHSQNVADNATNYLTALTLADGSGTNGGLASNYQLPTLDRSHAAASINKADLTLSGARAYNGGTTVAGSTLTATGVNGETFAITGAGDTTNLNSKNASTTAQTLASLTGLALGTSSNGGSSSNYNALSTTGSAFTINKADLTLSGARTYNGGTTVAGSTLTATGVNGETFAITGSGDTTNLNSKNASTTAQTLASLTGLSLGSGNNGASSSNYNALSTTGSAFTIDKANATITANSATKTYNGQAQSVTGFTASGLVGSETTAVLTGVTTTGGSGKDAASYTHTASGTDKNYNLTFVDGSLQIDKANLNITANNVTKSFDGNPYTGGNGVTYAGFVNGESVEQLNGTLSYGGNSQGSVRVGQFAIAPKGLSGANYNVRYVDGTLTVAAAKPQATEQAVNQLLSLTQSAHASVAPRALQASPNITPRTDTGAAPGVTTFALGNNGGTLQMSSASVRLPAGVQAP